MTEKEKNFLNVCKNITMSGGFSDKKAVEEFVAAAVERMEEISQTALNAVNSVSGIEKPLLAVSFKAIADTLYSSLNKAEQDAYGEFIKMAIPVMISVPERSRSKESESDE